MKKLIAFSTALFMLSSLSVSLVSAEDEAVKNESETTTETTAAAPDEKAEDRSEAAGTADSTPAEAEDTVSEDKGEDTNKPEKDYSVWHVHADSPAEAEFTDDTENKEYTVKIVNPGGEKRGGTDKWDLQFRIRGFEIKEGHEYTVKYRISASNAGSFYSKIGNPESETVGEATAGEVWHNQFGVSTVRSYTEGVVQQNAETSYGDAWSNTSIGKGDTLNVTCNFTGIADLPVAEWCFFLGGAGSTTSSDCFAPGASVRFTNLVLIDNTTGETLVSAYPFTDSSVKGDIDGDGKADTTDLSLMSLALIGDKVLDDAQITNCDVDGDNRFHIADIAKMKQYLAKIIEEL
ncbi:MAG: dockerin type I repeat-containing protein [Oscillospiraceae bacterium]|nr:dockerin type I repeat-containing protein [Oscillospiraceae bacterium]